MPVNTSESQAIVQTSSYPAMKKQGTKDLAKTRLCSFAGSGNCRKGADCWFAHSAEELRAAPDLKKTQLCMKFKEGRCNNENCEFAHGEAELRELPNMKRKPCVWFRKGECRNGTKCGFAHGKEELRYSPMLSPPPGLSPPEYDSLDAPGRPPPGLPPPRDTSPVKPTAPEEEMFLFMARRGAASLEKQVASLSLAISALQVKLAQLEDSMLSSQVQEMQQTIADLTNQQFALQAGLGMKSRLNTKAEPFIPLVEYASDDSTSVGSD